MNMLLQKGLFEEDLQTLLEEREVEREQFVHRVQTLENLPYDVFFSIVTRGNITGKDLIKLCNSSGRLTELCNRPRTINGQVQNQFLFREMLRKMGKSVKSDMDPKLSYLYYQVGLPKLFESLEAKIRQFSDLTEILGTFGKVSIYPRSIFNLLYPYPESFLYRTDRNQQEQRILNGLAYVFRTKNTRQTEMGKQEIENQMTLGLEILRQEYQNIAQDELYHLIEDRVKIWFNIILRNLQGDLFASHRVLDFYNAIKGGHTMGLSKHDFHYLENIFKPHGYDDFKTAVSQAFLGRSYSFVRAKDAVLILGSTIENYLRTDGILSLTAEEIGLILDIHQAVLDGKLRLDAPFTFEAIFAAL